MIRVKVCCISALPGVSLVQVIHFRNAASVGEAVEAASEADARLTDVVSASG